MAYGGICMTEMVRIPMIPMRRVYDKRMFFVHNTPQWTVSILPTSQECVQ